MMPRLEVPGKQNQRGYRRLVLVWIHEPD